jgi:serine/threonine-protein kinase
LREAQRIASLPTNASQKAFTLTVSAAAMGLMERAADWSALGKACEPWGSDVQAPQPALRLRIIQACASSAIHEGRLDQAVRLVSQGREVVRLAFATIPSRAVMLDLREGDIAWARGQAADAVAAWRRCLLHADDTGLVTRAQAWARLLQARAQGPSEPQALAAFRQRLLSTGGSHYFKEYLDLTGPI